MRKGLILLNLIIFLIISNIIYAQPFGDAEKSFRIESLSYENSSGAKEKTKFKYDNNGTLYKSLWSMNDSSRCSVNLYEYDSKGNLISAFRDFSDGITSFECFEYDNQGKKLNEHFFRSDNKSGYAEYFYKDSVLISANLVNHKGWLNGNLRFFYNKSGKKDYAILFNNTDTTCVVTYKYDKHGNMTSENWDFKGRWSQNFEYYYSKINSKIYNYTSPYLSGNSKAKIIKELYTFNNEKGGPSYYYYNDSDLLEKKVFIRDDGFETNTLYKYDKYGKLLSSEREISEDNKEYFTYLYDENDKLIRRSSYKSNALNSFESYIYNSSGELIKAYYKNMDGWLTGVINFAHDRYGKIISGKFKGENGFDASLFFRYNNEELLQEIEWVFTFGKFQRYTFDYL